MPRGISALYHDSLTSQYRGPTILNMADGDPPKDPPADPPKDPPKDPPSDPPANSAEARVQKALDKAKAAEKRAEELELAEKNRLEKEALARGEHETLLKKKDEELLKLKGDHESTSTSLKAYEEKAKAQIDKKLEAIKDEKKKASILKLLEGRSVLDQFDLVDEAISIVGGATGFGGPTPNPEDPTSDATKKARYEELLAKSTRTPQEQRELNSMLVEMAQPKQK